MPELLLLTADATSLGFSMSDFELILQMMTKLGSTLFVMYPINIFIVIAIASAGIGLISKGKGAVKK